VKTFRLAFLVGTLSCFGLVSAPAESTWLSNFQKAQTEAKASHKFLLLNFTGSDWCIWCKRLDAEVFAQPEFQSYAKDHLVLMTVDFPRRTALAPEVRKQNEELAQKYGVDGFPTIVVLNSEGKQVGLLGYQPGGASAFLKELQKLPPG
jgi:thioredoxin-related protein